MKLSYLMCEPVPHLSELGRRMEILAALGYRGIELSAKHPPDYSADDLLALSERVGLPVVSFLSGWSYSNEKLCLSSPRDEVRAGAVERLVQYVEYAARCRAVLVVGLMQGLRSDEPDETVAAARIADCLRPAAAAAAHQGTTLVIEPVNHLQVGFHHTAAEVESLILRVRSAGLGYMLDTIHMNIEEHSPLETIRAHGPKIRHFHLCESNGGPFGSGNLDFPAVLEQLSATGYGHYLSVKIYRRLSWEAGARQAAEFVRGLKTAAASPLLRAATGI